MMKKITLLLFVLLTVSFGYSQQVVLEDFDGAAPTFAGFEGLGSATITSGALELVSSSAGQPWQGAEVLMQNNLIDLTSDITVQLDINSSIAFDMFVKVENGTGPDSATATPHGGTGTETLTFTFNQSLDGTAPANGEYEKIVFFLNWDIGTNGWGASADFTVTIDNITAVAGTSVATPTCSDGIMNGDETGVDCGGTSCAACPPASLTNGDFETGDGTGWYGNALNVVDDGSGLNFVNQAEVTVAGAAFDVNISQDVSLTASTSYVLTFDAYTGTGATRDMTVGIGNNAAPWGANTVTTSLTDVKTTFQYELEANYGAEGASRVIFDMGEFTGFVFIDNVSLAEGTLGVEDLAKVAFKVYPNPSKSNWTVRTDNVTMSSVKVFDVLGKNVLSLSPNTTETTIDGSNLKSGLYFAQIKTLSGIDTVKLVRK